MIGFPLNHGFEYLFRSIIDSLLGILEYIHIHLFPFRPFLKASCCAI
jgi:hypothetical protein